MKKGEFKLIKEAFTPELVYFFLSLGLIIVSFPLYLIGKKYSMAIELMIPIFVIVYVFCLLPLWYENPRRPKLIAGATLLQAGNFSYICNMILVFFFTSHYSISAAGRAIISINCLNISFRRWLCGDSELPPLLFNWIMINSLLEGYNYTVQRNKVDLFLDK
jgi:predicted Kef-type K+ transport protein